MHTYLDIVIAGGGRVGFQTAKLLDDWDHDIVVVEEDPDVCDTIAEAHVAQVIQGDATSPEILEEAGVGACDVVAGVTGQTGINLAVCMMAKRLAPDVRSVARIDRAEQSAYTRFVDGLIFPEFAGARVAANEIMGSDVQTLADVTGTLDVMQIRVAGGAPAAGRELRDVRFPTGSLIISDDDGHRIARPDTTLDPGKRYVVAVEPDVADEVINLLRGA